MHVDLSNDSLVSLSALPVPRGGAIPGNYHWWALSIGIRSQQLNPGVPPVLPHRASGGWYVIGRCWVSLMCLPDKQIRLGSGTRTPLWLSFFLL